MRILGIDCAIPEASVALIDDGALLGEERQARWAGGTGSTNGKLPSNHAEILLPLIQTLFETTGVTVQQLSGIAVSIGPGSFTGLRIALATAKGLAYESGVPLVGVSTLHAGAARVRRGDALIGAMLDARKSEVYVALFRRARGDLTRVTDDAVMPIDAAVGLLQSHWSPSADVLMLVGDGAKAHELRLVDSLGTIPIVSGACRFSVAAEVARLGAERVAGAARDQGGVSAPVYLRLTEAEIKRRNSR
jgi:tRNA threonylcarbamoyladenosine biosynthesis protein TsaB